MHAKLMQQEKKKKDDWLCNLQEILGFYNKSL